MEEKKTENPGILNDGKDRFFDINGLRTGVPLNKRNLIVIIVCILAFFLLRALPLSAYGELSSTALAMVVVTLIIMVAMDINLVWPVLFLTVAGLFLNLWSYKTVANSIGGSPFVMMFGMIVVGMGCEFTPMGKRITYLILKKFGRKPASLVIAIGAVSLILSGFVSNNAVIVMMSAICATMLDEMGQVPGKSKLGKAIMIIVAAASMIGGAMLVNGCPVANLLGMSLLKDASGGLADISYLDWAKIGVPATLLCIFPMGWIYNKYFGVKNSDYAELPDTELYAKRLKELGPITAGS